MKCSNCDGKMVKFKYLNYEELEYYLSNEMMEKLCMEKMTEMHQWPYTR